MTPTDPPAEASAGPSLANAMLAIAANALGGAAIGFFAWILVGILGSKAAPELAPLLAGHLFAPWMAPWCVPFVGLFAATFGGTGSALRADLSALAVTLVATAIAAVLGYSAGVAIGIAAGGLVGAALVALVTEPAIELRLRRKPVRRAALLVGGLWLIALLIAGAVLSKKADIVACRVLDDETKVVTRTCQCEGQEVLLPEGDERRKRGVDSVCVASPGTTICSSAATAEKAAQEVPCRR